MAIIILALLLAVGTAVGAWALVSAQRRQNAIEEHRDSCSRLKTALDSELTLHTWLGGRGLTARTASIVRTQKDAFAAGAQVVADAAVREREPTLRALRDYQLKIARETFSGTQRRVLEEAAKANFVSAVATLHRNSLNTVLGKWPEVAAGIKSQSLVREECG